MGAVRCARRPLCGLRPLVDVISGAIRVADTAPAAETASARAVALLLSGNWAVATMSYSPNENQNPSRLPLRLSIACRTSTSRLTFPLDRVRILITIDLLGGPNEFG